MEKSRKKSKKQHPEQEGDIDNISHMAVDETSNEMKPEKVRARSASNKSDSCLKNLIDEDVPSQRGV